MREDRLARLTVALARDRGRAAIAPNWYSGMFTVVRSLKPTSRVSVIPATEIWPGIATPPA